MKTKTLIRPTSIMLRSMAGPKRGRLSNSIDSALIPPKGNLQPSQQSQAVFDEKAHDRIPSFKKLVIHIKPEVLD